MQRKKLENLVLCSEDLKLLRESHPNCDEALLDNSEAIRTMSPPAKKALAHAKHIRDTGELAYQIGTQWYSKQEMKTLMGSAFRYSYRDADGSDEKRLKSLFSKMKYRNLSSSDILFIEDVHNNMMITQNEDRLNHQSRRGYRKQTQEVKAVSLTTKKGFSWPRTRNLVRYLLNGRMDDRSHITAEELLQLRTKYATAEGNIDLSPGVQNLPQIRMHESTRGALEKFLGLLTKDYRIVILDDSEHGINDILAVPINATIETPNQIYDRIKTR